MPFRDCAVAVGVGLTVDLVAAAPAAWVVPLTPRAVLPGVVRSGMRVAEVVADFLRAGTAAALVGARLVTATVVRVLFARATMGCFGRRDVGGVDADADAVRDEDGGFAVPVAGRAGASVPLSSSSEQKGSGSSAGRVVSNYDLPLKARRERGRE